MLSVDLKGKNALVTGVADTDWDIVQRGVEKSTNLFRLMIATMWRRHYESDGLAKLCSVACYELTMYKYQLRERADRRLVNQVREIVARVNNHSLTLLEEMFDFVRRENIYDARRVNDQAAVWAGRVNLFDFEVGQELASLRTRISQDALWPAGGSDDTLGKAT